MLAALRQASVLDFVAGLKDGLDTVVGDRGILVVAGRASTPGTCARIPAPSFDADTRRSDQQPSTPKTKDACSMPSKAAAANSPSC